MNSSVTVETPAPTNSWMSPQPLKTVDAQPEAAPESRWRSVAKAISWRALGTVDTMVISFFVTGKIKLAVSIGFVELFTKVALFYFHERAWHKIPYGKSPTQKD